MASRSELNEIYRTGFSKSSIPFLSEVFEKCKLGYNSIDVKKTSDKHGISPMVIPTMVDLQILTCTGQKKTAKFHWKAGTIVSTDLALRIYDKMAANKRVIKENKKREEQHTMKTKIKNLVPIVGSKRLSATHDQTSLVCRAMTAVHASTKESLLNTAMITDLVKHEIGNETLSERIVKALIDGNYIASKTSFPDPANNLYAWKEQAPNDEHALFVCDMIKENVGHNRANKIFDFLLFLYGIKTFTPLNLRKKIREHKLSSNDQSVITAEVLEYEGNKLNRSYKWKAGTSAPSMQMAEEIAKKAREYGAQYNSSNKGSTPKHSEGQPVPSTPQNGLKYGSKTNVILNYLAVHKTITTDEAAKLLPEMSMHAVSNIFWRICKDKVVKRIAHKTYSIDATVQIVKPIETAKPIVDSSFVAKLKDAIQQMKKAKAEKEKAHKTEMDLMDAKLREAEQLLSVKENETAFLDSMSVFITDSYKVPHHKIQQAVKNSQPEKRTWSKHQHSRDGIISLLAIKPIVTLDDVSNHFYPTRNLGWNDNEYKSLSSMMYQLKKENKIEAAGHGSYQLKK